MIGKILPAIAIITGLLSIYKSTYVFRIKKRRVYANDLVRFMYYFLIGCGLVVVGFDLLYDVRIFINEVF